MDILWPPLTNILGMPDVGIKDMVKIPVKNLASEFCDLLSREQLLQLSTPTYKIRKEKQKSKEVLVDPSTVTVVSQAEQEGTDRPSVNSSVDFSLPAPSFCKDLQDLDEKWSVRMARLEALITMGQRPPS